MKVEIEMSAVSVNLEDLETRERAPRGLCTGVVLPIVAVHLGLIGLGGGHTLAGVVLESGIWCWYWLGNNVPRLGRTREGASTRVDGWWSELLWRDVVLVGGVIGKAVVVVVIVVIGIVISIRLVILLVLMLLLLVLLAIVRRDLGRSERRGTGWLAERVRVANPSGAIRSGLREVVGRTRPAKDALVGGVPRLWRGRRLRSGTHTTSWIHVRRRCGLWGVRGVWRGRAEGWVGSAQPWCRPSLGLGCNRRRWRG